LHYNRQQSKVLSAKCLSHVGETANI